MNRIAHIQEDIRILKSTVKQMQDSGFHRRAATYLEKIEKAEKELAAAIKNAA